MAASEAALAAPAAEASVLVYFLFSSLVFHFDSDFDFLITGEAGCCFQAWERTFRRLSALSQLTFRHRLRRYLAQARKQITKVEIFQRFPKTSECFQKLPSASKRVPTHPGRPKQVQTRLRTNENLEKLCENFAKTSRKLRENFAKVAFVPSLIFVTDGTMRCH